MFRQVSVCKAMQAKAEALHGMARLEHEGQRQLHCMEGGGPARLQPAEAPLLERGTAVRSLTHQTHCMPLDCPVETLPAK